MLKEKLLSRKLWLAVIGAGAGIAIALGAPESIVSVLVGAATALVSVVIYIVTEGKIDAAAVEMSADLVQRVLDAIEALKPTVNTNVIGFKSEPANTEEEE